MMTRRALCFPEVPQSELMSSTGKATCNLVSGFEGPECVMASYYAGLIFHI